MGAVPAALLLWLTFSALSAAPALGQERRTDPVQAVASRLPRLGSVVRVQSRGGGVLQGRLRGLAPDQLVLESRLGGRFEVPAEDVDLLLERGTRWEDGAAVGAGVAGAAGLVLGLIVTQLPCDTGTCQDSGFTIVFGTTAIFALSGGVLGALVGSLIEDWEPVAAPGPGS